jgi:hypothetical protein
MVQSDLNHLNSSKQLLTHTYKIREPTTTPEQDDHISFLAVPLSLHLDRACQI